MISNMTTLKKAQAIGNLDQFIKEQEKRLSGDDKRFEKALKSMTGGTPKEAQEASSKAPRDD